MQCAKLSTVHPAELGRYENVMIMTMYLSVLNLLSRLTEYSNGEPNWRHYLMCARMLWMFFLNFHLDRKNELNQRSALRRRRRASATASFLAIGLIQREEYARGIDLSIDSHLYFSQPDRI